MLEGAKKPSRGYLAVTQVERREVFWGVQSRSIRAPESGSRNNERFLSKLAASVVGEVWGVFSIAREGTW